MTLRLMFQSDYLRGHSAYSKVTYESAICSAKAGYKVAHTPIGRANNMGKQEMEDIIVYPSGNDIFAEDVAVANYIDFKADMLLAIKEPWCWQKLYKQAINFVPFAIIDHSPVSTSITNRLRTAFKVIAITRFGQRELKRANIESTYVPHGVRTDVFKPLDRNKCRKLWFLDEDEFVVGIVAMNRARKMIPRMLRGYREFLNRNPDVKSHLMLWTNVYPSRYPIEKSVLGVSDVGVSLLPEIMRLGLGEAIRFPDEKTITKGIPDWMGENYTDGYDMVKLYNTLDALLFCTGGEGFGLPLVEAQSCGVPVITTDYAGGPEQVGVGFTIRWNDYVVYDTPGVRRPLANLDKMADALTKIMNADRERTARKTRKFALRYDWNRIAEQYWIPFLTSCEEELYPLITKAGVKSWA